MTYSFDTWEARRKLALELATKLVAAKMGSSFYYRDPTAHVLRSAARMLEWMEEGTITDEPEEETI